MLSALRNAPHLLAPLTANCRAFHAKWDQAARAPSPAGRWEGEWRSEASGHHGPLLCVIEIVDPTTWRATFRAGYAAVFRACYTTDLRVSQDNQRWTFRGESNIGRLAGGNYSYEGEATDAWFVSRYRSQSDHGEFRLSRVK
jgi:hypothetical protein